MKITFQLVCQKNPQVKETEDILEIRRVDLSACEIDSVSNLEIFSHIEELDLSRNALTNVRNISFFDRLQFLDVSYNCITAEGLQQSLAHIPMSLTTINLTGNPCAKDEDVLNVLQTTYPNLAIAIEEVEDEGESKNGADGGKDEEGKGEEEGDENEESAAKQRTSRGPVNADEVLKEIVDRKCKMQNFVSFNLNFAVAELESETTKAIEASHARRSSHHAKIDTSKTDAYLRSVEERSAVMLQRNQAESTAFREVMARMKESTAKLMREIKPALVQPPFVSASASAPASSQQDS